jgi:hypothetical protein
VIVLVVFLWDNADGDEREREKKVSSVFIIILGRFEIVFYGLANAIKIRNVFHGSERGGEKLRAEEGINSRLLSEARSA